MNAQTVALPDSEEMLKRLVTANPQPHYQEYFYPLFLKFAGQSKNAGGIVMMIALCIADYRKAQQLDAVMQTMLFMEAPEIIDALVDDPTIAAQAKARLETALSQGAK